MAMNEWDQPWFNRGYWILENLDKLSLDRDEMLVVIVMNYLMETHSASTISVLVS